jgi:hypothetical protein
MTAIGPPWVPAQLGVRAHPNLGRQAQPSRLPTSSTQLSAEVIKRFGSFGMRFRIVSDFHPTSSVQTTKFRGNMELQGGWSKQIWLRLYLKLVAVVGFLIQILNNIVNPL